MRLRWPWRRNFSPPIPARPLLSSPLSVTPALSPGQPRVWLGFVDGSQCELDPWSRDARALLAVARALGDAD